MLNLGHGYSGLLFSEIPIGKKISALVKHKFIPFEYNSFWDVPSEFFTEFKSKVFLFYRPDFDDEIDDYPPNYEVYIYENISLKEAVQKNLWNPWSYEEKILVGEIPTSKVIFDTSMRKYVNTVVFEMIELSKNAN